MTTEPSRPAKATALALAGVTADAEIVLCVGPGGVGKTSTAAAIAIHGASQGRNVAVVTIDPARRLADALRLAGALSNQPQRVPGPWPGSLDALMLDTKDTFDDLVARYASDDEQRQRILGNRFYRNVSNALSGTQEYMAGEKLYELHSSGRYDLVVVDTPPSRNALDFLDSANQLARLLDHRVYRVMTSPGRGVGRALNLAAQAVLRRAARVVGAEVIDDAIAFFAAFEGLEAGFRNRSQHVRTVLASERAAFVLVATPRLDTVGEALHFVDQLASHKIRVRGLVVNRLHPRFSGPGEAEARQTAARLGGKVGTMYTNLADFAALTHREEGAVDTLVDRIGSVAVARVPLFDDDVHDLDGLRRIASHLFESASIHQAPD